MPGLSMQGMPQIPQRVQQAVGQAVTQAAVNELMDAFRR